MLGIQEYHGIELYGCGIFDIFEGLHEHAGRKRVDAFDWKNRYMQFKKELLTFQSPFDGRIINEVENMNEVAHCKCMIRADALVQESSNMRLGIYIEIKVEYNSDNLSLAVVDCQAGGHSSVTFSPDIGAVILKKKLKEPQGKVEAAYIQPLREIPLGERFQGSMGCYILDGHVAFLRRFASGPWETTGFVTGLAWAHGNCLTPCLAFRDEGAYKVSIKHIGHMPPIEHTVPPMSYNLSDWTVLDWD